MSFHFEILCVAPVMVFWDFLDKLKYQNEASAYLATQECSLDVFLQSLSPMIQQRGWDSHLASQPVIQFWLHNPETISLWKHRLEDAGKDNLLVSRLSNYQSLRRELQMLWGK